MQSVDRPYPRRARFAGPVRALALSALALSILTACGSSSKTSSSGTAATPPSVSTATGVGSKTSGQTGAAAAPASIKSAGKIVYCSEIDFAPLESYNGSTAVGADIDIGNAIAQRIGVSAEFTNTGFDALIAALQAKKCDAIISGLNDTPQRRQQISFVDYIKIGQSLIVPAGNPQHVSDLASLSGRSVATVTGTTQASFLNAENTKLAAAGKPKISISLFSQNSTALAAVITHKADVDFDSATYAAIAVKKNPSLAVAGDPINPVPDGIGIRSDDPQLRTAISSAVDALYSDGTMHQILAKYGLTASALK